MGRSFAAAFVVGSLLGVGCGDDGREPPRGSNPVVGASTGAAGAPGTGGGGSGGSVMIACDDPQVECRSYEGDCSQFPDTHAEWQFLSYDTTTPAGAEVRFDVRTADDEGALSGASWSRAGTATHEDEDAIPSAPIHLDDVLDPGEVIRPWLQLRVARIDSAEGETPAVEGWDLTFTCAAN